jgi:hypothetical protein
VNRIFSKFFADWNINCKWRSQCLQRPGDSCRLGGYSSELEDEKKQMGVVCPDEIRSNSLVGCASIVAPRR